jgi:hypothetical protein
MLQDYPEMQRHGDNSDHQTAEVDGADFLNFNAKKTLVTTGIMTRARDFG